MRLVVVKSVLFQPANPSEIVARLTLLPHSCACHRNPACPSPWAQETLLSSEGWSFTAQTRGEWIPVTSTGMSGLGNRLPPLQPLHGGTL
jgi:hypothetical protein